MKILLFILLSMSLHSSLSAKSKIKIVQDLVGVNFKVLKVEKSHGNLHIVYTESGELLYVDMKHKLLFYGSLLQMKDGELVNLTREDRNKYQVQLDKNTIKTIDMKEIKKIAVLDKINGGNSQNVIVVFDSLTCPYCIKVNRFLKNNNYKINAYKIFNKSGSVDDLLEDKFGVKNTSKKLNDMESLFRKYKIVSTPNIFVLKNNKIIKIIKGANMKEIKKWIKK